jgi:peptidoglycan/LPS O-acetylase OafA/YrhL
MLSDGGRYVRRPDFAPFALYYRNFLGPDRGSDIYVGQFWSLCVEEQFYLVWPLVIYFCSKRFRIPIISGIFLTTLFLRSHLLARGVPVYIVERLTYCRMDDLVAEAAIAVLIRHGIAPVVLKRLCWSAIAIGGVGLLVVGRAGTSIHQSHFVTVGLSCYALFYGGVVGMCSRKFGNTASRILGSSFLKAISKRSYAMYVFHLVPLYALHKLLSQMWVLPLRPLPAIGVMLMLGLVTYGPAWLSWKYLEAPILRLKDWEWFAK